MEWIALGIILIVIIAVVWYNTRDTKIIKVDKNQVFNIKNSLELTGFPVIVLYQNGEKYNFMLDTGSNVSYVDIHSGLELSDAIGRDNFLTAVGDGNYCTVHNVKLYYGKNSFELPVRVSDMDGLFQGVKQSFGVTLAGLLGGDFLSKYSYVLDYAEYVVYSRKI